MKTFYQVWVNEDSTEGRGRQIPFAAFTNPLDAQTVARGRGPMGASDEEVREIPVFDSIQEWKDRSEEMSIRERALRKLSLEERKALGL